MKLAYKLISGYLSVASIVSSANYFVLRSYGNIDTAFHQLTNASVPTVKTLNELKYAGKRSVALTDEVERFNNCKKIISWSVVFVQLIYRNMLIANLKLS